MSNNTIIIKRSSVTGKKPTEAQLQYGELSINYADGELYYKSSDNTIKAIGQKYGEDIEALKSGKLDANGTALKATSDASGNNIANTYIKGLTVNGKVITYTKGNGDTGTITTQDTTYGAATSNTLGLVKVGSNITNSSGTISLTKANVTSALGYTPPTTDTTYSAFVGASASADGSNGLVPTPVKGKQDSFLRGDGTWATPLNTTYTGSDGISLTGTNFTNSGVRSIASGTTANTLSVNTGGTTKTLTIDNVANATKASQDSAGNVINTTYIKGLSVNGKVITYTKGDGTTATITTQDTTYGAGAGLSLSGTTFTNSGVRSVKAGTSANQLSVDTNGTTSTITINNVANATKASSADKLTTARTITLDGDLSGSVSFDGSENVTLTATVADDSHNHTIANIDGLQTALNAKAPLASPTFTGTPKAPTATSGTNTTQIATTAFVQSEINSKIAAADAMIFKGTIGTGGTVTALPNTHTTGWTYKVITAGTYAGQKCEVGDLITCLTDGTTANDSHWTVIQTNIDGAVTGPTSSVANRVAVFDGTTGKIIKDSGYTIAASVPSGAKFTDTTYSAGTGLSLNGTTFTNSGVRSVVLGDTANVLKVNTNGTEASITINNVANATSATTAGKLSTARTIAISGGATGTATSFDGSENITIPVTALDVSKATAGTLSTARGGTGRTDGKVTALATTRYIDGVGFTGAADVIHFGTCSTEATTVEKVVACSNYALKTGSRIIVKFTVTNKATNPTLNVNSTGAKAIYYRGVAIKAGYLAANRIYEFVYNGTQYELIGDIDTNSDTKVTQTITTTNAEYSILGMADAAATATKTNGARFSTGITMNPSTNTITATTFKGALSGNATSATKATQDGNGKVIATTYAKLSGATFTGAVTTPNLTVTERAKMPAIVEYESDVTESYTINNNSMSGHYVQIADNVTVTIANGAIWSIG